MRLNSIMLMIVIMLLIAGCQGRMIDQPRYEPFEPSDEFANGTSARPLIENTVPRGSIIDNEVLRTGFDDGDPTTDFPLPVTLKLLERGQERYNIYCTPCHGLTGHGDGMIVQRGFPAPPSFHSDRLRNAPHGHYFDVITNGFGVMFDYAARVSVMDRWAIIAYIRALQVSQNAQIDQLNQEDREQLPE